MLTKFIKKIIDRKLLSIEEAEKAMKAILDGAEASQIAAFLAVLKYRGETPEEIVGMANALKKVAKQISLPFSTMDLVGTGGDGANTVNISTGSAILAAACGIPIAKHGNRSVSSKCGSADVLEGLGISIEMPPEFVENCIKEVGIGFLFAPYYNTALKQLRSIRKELKISTIFNLLGPLLNPSQPDYALIGVAHESVLEQMGQIIVQLKSFKRVLVVHGNGLDELTPLGPIKVLDIEEGQVRRFEIAPHSLGIACCTLKELQGGEVHENAWILKQTLQGKPGAIADALALNAGCALWIYGMSSSLTEGVVMAQGALKNGLAYKVLEKWIVFSKSLKEPVS